jgi:prepilin-type N-terminal cleavage/methylation domain-containing protein
MPQSPPPKPIREGIHAFTLLEVLVTSAILGMVLFVLLSVVSTTLELWRGSRMELSVTREGRTGMSLVDMDLRNIILLTNANNSLMPRINTNNYNERESFVAMQFLTIMPPDYQGKSERGDLCYVEYRFTNQSFKRGFANSTVTFEALKKNEFPALSEEDFEIVAANVMRARMWAWDSEGNSTAVVDAKGVANPSLRSVGIRLEGVYEEFLRNHIDFSDKIWASENFKTKQYFHSIYPVPKPL